MGDSIKNGLLWETLAAEVGVPSDSAAAATGNGNRTSGTRRLPYEKQCAAFTKSGRRCRGKIVNGSEFCPFHNPQLSAERRRRNAAKGGRSHHRLSHLPDGYLCKLTSRRAVGEAMDRLYREVRLGVITAEMGRVLFGILTRILDSELYTRVSDTRRKSRSAKVDGVRVKLGDLLTRAEQRAWRRAVASAPAEFLHAEPPEKAALKRAGKRVAAEKEQSEKARQVRSADASDTAIRLAMSAS